MDTSPSASAPKIKFDLKFIEEATKYLEIYKKSGRRPSVEGFANRIGTDKDSVIAWANKKKKDEKGNITDELARPTFHAIVQKIIEAENAPDDRLTAQQEKFCQLYASDREFFANGTQSYIEAYGLDANDSKDYRNAMASASRLLVDVKILNRINELLEDGGLNDVFVDKQLKLVISQNADFSSKVAAIREYNKLKTRIIDRIDHTTKGKELPTPIYGGKSGDKV